MQYQVIMCICFGQFAEAACGVVHVMLNGSIEAGAFRTSRYTQHPCFCWACVLVTRFLAASSGAEWILVNSCGNLNHWLL